MERKTIIEGITVAFILSVIAFPMVALGSAFSYPLFSVKLCAAGVAYIYVIYLLARTSTRIGRGSVGALSLLAISALLFCGASLFTVVLGLTAIVWLVRALYSYHSLVFALGDAALCGLSLFAAAWGFMISHSVMVAVWCFFLIQALATVIPRSFAELSCARQENRICSLRKSDKFSEAERAAASALRQLVK